VPHSLLYMTGHPRRRRVCVPVVRYIRRRRHRRHRRRHRRRRRGASMHIYIYIYIYSPGRRDWSKISFFLGWRAVSSMLWYTLSTRSPLDTHPHHPAPPPFFRGLRGSFSPRAGYHISLDVDDIFRPPSLPPPFQRPTIVRSTYDARARRIGHNSIVEEEGAR
jgi:hypothetical protein